MVIVAFVFRRRNDEQEVKTSFRPDTMGAAHFKNYVCQTAYGVL
jgi:hypothetical protein